MPDDRIRAALGAGGELSKRLPSYEPRQPQLQMADAVLEALKRGRALVVEAGTGTGKTLAYLLPAALCGLKVVVSTATKALQEQLADKDVPLLQSLGVKATFAFLKGRQNYLCLAHAEQFSRDPLFQDPAEARYWPVIEEWSKSTRTGDRAELDDVPEGLQLWRDLTSTPDSCTGTKCEQYDACHVFKQRKLASEADVVIVNHHLFFADLRLRSSSAGDTGAAVLPKYDAVIFDEAQGVEDTVTDHFSATLSSHRISELLADAKLTLGKKNMLAAQGLLLRLQQEGPRYFSKAAECRPADSRPLPAPRKRRSSLLPEFEDARWIIAQGSLAPAEHERQALAEIVRALGAELSRAKDDEEVALLERRCSDIAAELELFAEGAGIDDTQVRWAEIRGGPLVPARLADRRRQRLAGQALRQDWPRRVHQRDPGGRRHARLLRAARRPARRRRAALSH